jgi:hypothetical protein
MVSRSFHHHVHWEVKCASADFGQVVTGRDSKETRTPTGLPYCQDKHKHIFTHTRTHTLCLVLPRVCRPQTKKLCSSGSLRSRSRMATLKLVSARPSSPTLPPFALSFDTTYLIRSFSLLGIAIRRGRICSFIANVSVPFHCVLWPVWKSSEQSFNFRLLMDAPICYSAI